ncbi:gypsy type transposase [Tanacetum coccineum]
MAENYEPIMPLDIEEIQAEREEKIQRDLTFFSRALSFFVCLPKPKRQKRTNINRDYYGAQERLVAAYFRDNLMFPEAVFEDRFLMSRSLFRGIVEECTSAIRQLAYGTIPDALDEYLHMGNATSRQCLEYFCTSIIQISGPEFLRKPTLTDVERLYAFHENKHGLSGMLGSLDCTDWAWFGCPIAHKAQYCRRDHGPDPFILLEVVASNDLWIWHTFFGVSGSNNDINVTQRSPLLNDLKLGKAPEVSFVANDVTYPWGYYLCDGIYPEWVPFIKSVTNLADDDQKRLRYKKMHEAARKDVERTFGVLKKRWAILATPARAYIKEKLANIMYTCIILHNMIIKDRKEAICPQWYPEEEHKPDDLIRSDEQRYIIIRDTIQLEDAISTIFEEYLLEFTSEYGIPESLHPELPGLEEPIVEFPEGKVGVYTKFFDANYHMDLFNMISALNPAKVKTETRPRAAHEVPLLTVTASRVIDMEDTAVEDTAVASGSSGTPSTLEKSPLNFTNEDPPQMITEMGGMKDQVQDGLSHEIPPVETAMTTEVIQEPGLEKEVAAMGLPVNKRRRKRGNDEAEANAPPKVLRKDHAAFCPAQSTLGGKSLTSIGLEAGSPFFTPASQETSADAKSVSDPEPLSFAKQQPHPERDVAQSSRKTAPEIPTENVATTKVQDLFSVESPGSGKSTSVPSVDGSPGGIYQPGWGVTNNCCLDTPYACQDLVDHIVPPGLLKKATAKIARRDQRIQAREEEIKKMDQAIKSIRTVEAEVHSLHNQTKNLETLLESEVDMKKAAEAKNARLAKELESLRVQFLDLHVSNNQLSQQVSNLQAQVTGEEKIKAAFKEFKKYEDDRVEQRCSEMDARLDKLSVDFDEELYPYMLTAIAGHRWVLGHDLRLAVMKCAESPELRQVFADVVSAGLVKGMREYLKHGIEHGMVTRDLAAVEASSQLKIPIYLEVRDPEDPWAFKKEMLLEDSIAANISRAKKKKKCRVVYRTHGIGSAHHARSDGIPVSVPTIAPRGLAILLADAATQTKVADEEDEPHPRLHRSISLPPFYNLEWK